MSKLQSQDDLYDLQNIFEPINYSFAGVSLLCSIFIIFITNKNKKAFSSKNNLFILQLLYSEIINNVTQLSTIILNLIGSKQLKYDERMRICYIQIFTGLFSNFFCLTSTLLISYHLYDLFLKHGAFFSNNKNFDLCRTISFYGSLFLSYIIFTFQMNKYQNRPKTIAKFRMVSCWVSEVLDWVTWSIFIILIMLTCIYSWKCYAFIRKYSQTYLSTKNENDKKDSQYVRIHSMQKRLIGYPFVNIVVFMFLLVNRLMVYFNINDTRNGIVLNFIIGFVLFTVPTCMRGLLYMGVYFGTQRIFRKELWKVCCCIGNEEEDPIENVLDKELGKKESKGDCNILPNQEEYSQTIDEDEEEDDENTFQNDKY